VGAQLQAVVWRDGGYSNNAGSILGLGPTDLTEFELGNSGSLAPYFLLRRMVLTLREGVNEAFFVREDKGNSPRSPVSSGSVFMSGGTDLPEPFLIRTSVGLKVSHLWTRASAVVVGDLTEVRRERGRVSNPYP
jgi:hypothetical protein